MVGRTVNIGLLCSDVVRTHGLIRSAEDNTRNEHDDDFDGVQCKEGAKDEPRLIVQCPHTEDRRYYSIKCHSFISLEVNMNPHTLRPKQKWRYSNDQKY